MFEKSIRYGPREFYFNLYNIYLYIYSDQSVNMAFGHVLVQNLDSEIEKKKSLILS